MKGAKSTLIKTVMFFDILLIFCVVAIIAYYLYFYPKTPNYQSTTKSLRNIAEKIEVKMKPENIDVPSQEITVFSSINFSEEDLTDLLVLSLNDMPELKQYLKGLKVRIDGNFINLDANVTYKNLPLKATFTFQGKVSDGKGILHYEEGKIGFFTIPENMIFSNLKNSHYLKVSEDSKDIILDIAPSKFVQITDILTENKSLKVKLRGTISLLK